MQKLTKYQHKVLNLIADSQQKNPNSKNPILKEVAKIQDQLKQAKIQANSISIFLSEVS